MTGHILSMTPVSGAWVAEGWTVLGKNDEGKPVYTDHDECPVVAWAVTTSPEVGQDIEPVIVVRDPTGAYVCVASEWFKHVSRIYREEA